MSLTCRERDRELTARVGGELDHHRAREVMEELDRRIDESRPRELTLDLSGLTFTDSSGIAVLLRAHRRVGLLGGTMTVQSLPEFALVIGIPNRENLEEENEWLSETY